MEQSHLQNLLAKQSREKPIYATDSSHSTVGLFDDNLGCIDKTNAYWLGRNENSTINNLVTECSAETKHSLRQAITKRLAKILEDLNGQKISEKH
tara:strand:- start:39 stop:323 length:285 start_codon:yes stop_codon:yes gene_type:complete